MVLNIFLAVAAQIKVAVRVPDDDFSAYLAVDFYHMAN